MTRSDFFIGRPGHRSVLAIFSALLLIGSAWMPVRAAAASKEEPALNESAAPASARPAVPGGAAPEETGTIAGELASAILDLKVAGYGRDGKVDYAALKGSAAFANYRRQAARLRDVDLDHLGSATERTAFWINLYNAMVVDGLIAEGVPRKVTDVPDFFRRTRYRIGPYLFSLDDIEHGILRGNRPAEGQPAPFGPDDPRRQYAIESPDPRVHFALVCGARSCPPIAVYDAAHLDQQLDLAAKAFINSEVRWDPGRRRLELSELFRWYRNDFGPAPADLVRFIARYLTDEPARAALLAAPDKVRLAYTPYDWLLNRAG